MGKPHVGNAAFIRMGRMETANPELNEGRAAGRVC
jgi:hypothetical protein